ncbi:LATERAL ORGAN BOUNDARIES protein [Nymphaea thermarum]|nr:LATERAL ORGAN BOUNDARIES protein [Nymphaea thermarum]
MKLVLAFFREEPQKFANVHKIFGASNVSKLLNELMPHQREDAVNSLAYEAEARMKDPVQVHQLQKELDAANADLMRYACIPTEIPRAITSPSMAAALPLAQSRSRHADLARMIANGSPNYQASYYPPPYPSWRSTRDGSGRDM